MSLRLAWAPEGWEDYLYWQAQDRKTLRRVNLLIADVLRGDPFEGIGKPEPLKESLAGFWSRRIDDTNRLVYTVADSEVIIIMARDHY